MKPEVHHLTIPVIFSLPQTQRGSHEVEQKFRLVAERGTTMFRSGAPSSRKSRRTSLDSLAGWLVTKYWPVRVLRCMVCKMVRSTKEGWASWLITFPTNTLNFLGAAGYEVLPEKDALICTQHIRSGRRLTQETTQLCNKDYSL